MPRYYFHSRNGAGYSQDPHGFEVADVDEAHHAAVRSARAIIAADARLVVLDLTTTIEVEDQHGKRVLTVRFDQAVSIRAVNALR